MVQTDYVGLAKATQLVGTLPGASGAGTVVALLNGTGFPTGATGINFVLTFDRNTATEEKILFSLRSGNNVTVAQRGYDDTVAVTHTAGTVEHTVDATVLRLASAHLWDTTRDDHTQYMKVDGTRTATGLTTFTNGIRANASSSIDLFGSGRNLNFRPALADAGANMGIQSADWNGDTNYDGIRINGSDGIGFGTSLGLAGKILGFTGNLSMIGGANTFGAGVFGAASTFIGIGTYDATFALINAGHGTAANAGLLIQPKGTGSLYVRDGSSNAVIEVASTSKLGFFGTAAVVKPTGVAVTAAGVHAALVTLGLITA